MKKLSIVLLCMTLSQVILFAQNTNQVVRKVKVMEQKFDKSDNTPELDSEATFDANGNVLEEIEYKDGKIVERILYKYDAEGNKLSEVKYNKSGDIYETIEYKYNGKLRIEKIVYDAKKKMKSKKTYQYDF